MKTSLLLLTLALATAAVAREHDYQSGTLVRMDSSACGSQEKDGKTLTGELLGTDAQNKKTHLLLCQEYVLESDRVVYHIRPKDENHPALLPIGENAQFRIHKDKLILRVPEADGKEREYLVVSMAPRQDKTPPLKLPARTNGALPVVAPYQMP